MKTKILIDILLGLVFLYIVFSIVIKTEPFNFEITNTEDVTIAVAAIFFTLPWITLYYYCGKLFRSIRVRKNAKIKSNSEYCYYRDDLNRISPSIVMFTLIMAIETIVYTTVQEQKALQLYKEIGSVTRTIEAENIFV